MKILIKLVIEAIITAIINIVLKLKQAKEIAQAKLSKEKSIESVKEAEKAVSDFDSLDAAYKSTKSSSDKL